MPNGLGQPFAQVGEPFNDGRHVSLPMQAQLVAIRLACIELAAPRPLEENLPTGGIPPPVGRSRRHSNPASASQLRCSGWILQSVARALCMPIRTLLTEARRRWTTANPTTR
jgi:hypothetical protein